MAVRRGFTLIELLVVVSIIGLLSSIVLTSVASARARAQDAKRLSDMRQIQIALELYFSANGQYPDNADNDCGGWDAGFNGGPSSGDVFIRVLETSGVISKVPGDSKTTGNCGGYAYYRYPAGSGGCSTSQGAYYVLGVRDMESSGNPHPQSPGWRCPSRNWQDEFDWVTGSFEK